MTRTQTKSEATEKKRALLEQFKNAKAIAIARQPELSPRYASVLEQIDGISYNNFVFVLLQMEAFGYEGLPYIDVKTYDGWKAEGRQVCKGEKSLLKAIVWVGREEQEERRYPKVAHLFHRSQTEEIGDGE